jgi:hypothetical protein
LVDQWSVFESPYFSEEQLPWGTVDSAMWQNQYVMIREDGVVLLETADYRDIATTYIPLDLTTSWIKLNGLQGYQRVWWISLLGEVYDYCTINYEIFYDYVDANPQTGSVVVDANFAANPPAQFRVKPRYGNGKCQAFKIRLYDATATGATNYKGFAISDLMVQIGKKPGVMRQGILKTRWYMGDWLMGTPPGKSKYELGGGAAGGTLQDLMLQRAQGQGPSAAELMMNRGMQQQIAAGRSAAASMPGVSPGLAMRQAGQREASAMSNVGQQAGIMRAQEQAAAQQMLAQWLQQQEQMKLQQEMYNASRMRQGGMLGPMLGMGAQMGAAALGMPWGGGQMPMGSTPNAYGGYGAPSWEDKGFGQFGWKP